MLGKEGCVVVVVVLVMLMVLVLVLVVVVGNVFMWFRLVAVGFGIDGEQNYCILPLRFMSALLLCSR